MKYFFLVKSESATFKLIFLTLSLLFSSNLIIAQDTDVKDEPSYITIYIQIKTNPSPCISCYDSLASKIKKLEHVKEVKAFMGKALMTFQIPSSNLIKEDRLMEMTRESGLTPIEVKFEKEDPELIDKPVNF